MKELATFDAGRAPVTSLYVDVDGRRYVRSADLERHLDDLLRSARQQAAALDRDAQASVEADSERIRTHLRNHLDRSRTRGVAVFASAAAGLWRVVELPYATRDRVVVNSSPYLRELERLREHALRLAVVLADRQHTRCFVFHHGELVERAEIDDPLPRHDDDGGDLTRDQVAGQAAAAAHRHLRRSAGTVFKLLRETGFDHLIVSAPDEIAAALERELHPYVRDRLGPRLSVPLGAPDEDIRRAVAAVEEELDRARGAALVAQLRDALGAGRGAVAGLADTLGAVVARRVGTLLVSEGYEAPGWRCPSCGFVGIRGRSCPVCEANMTALDDVVEAAVEEAVAQSCRAYTVVDADLDVMGRIGALLRY